MGYSRVHSRGYSQAIKKPMGFATKGTVGTHKGTGLRTGYSRGTHRVSYGRTHGVVTGVLMGYSQVIKKPMDLTTLRKRVETGQVRTGYSRAHAAHACIFVGNESHGAIFRYPGPMLSLDIVHGCYL
jgi:hypothetical protein